MWQLNQTKEVILGALNFKLVGQKWVKQSGDCNWHWKVVMVVSDGERSTWPVGSNAIFRYNRSELNQIRHSAGTHTLENWLLGVWGEIPHIWYQKCCGEYVRAGKTLWVFSPYLVGYKVDSGMWKYMDDSQLLMSWLTIFEFTMMKKWYVFSRNQILNFYLFLE